MMPSQKPSEKPSFAPSSSFSPSFGPTVSAVPTTKPSLSPSNHPTSTPSDMPSPSPSVSLSPSSTPTTGAPSSTPSTGEPSSTPSQIPSDSPSIHSVILSAIIGVTLDLHDPLDDEVSQIFEGQAKQFLESQWETDMPLLEGMSINIVDLQVTEQTVIPKRRQLADKRYLHAAGLRIRFNVTGEVLPGNLPSGFSFSDEVSRPFRENFGTFIFQLHSQHKVFAGLVDGTQTNPDSASTDIEPVVAGRASAGAIAGIVIASVGSVALAIVAGMYAIKSRRSDCRIVRKPMIDMYQIERSDSHSTSMTPYNGAEALTPHSMESGSGANATRPSSKSLFDLISKNGSDEENQDANSDLGLKLSDAVLGAHALKKEQPGRTRSSRGSDPPAVGISQLGARPNIDTSAGGSLCYSDDDSTSCGDTPTSVQLTPAASETPSSVFSSLANLGARPMETAEQLHFHHETGSVGSSTINGQSVKRTGLYDVFAPSGPLGIVVDTTRDGPIVHSMKPTSPLLGLITPGDLIVGLDDMDTRSMTAATLTRMMAKRSHQAERKLTLLAFEGGSTVN